MVAELKPDERIFAVIHDVLLNQWDPIGIADEPAAQDEYDSYVWGVYGHVLRGDEKTLADHLTYIATQLMGLHANVERDMRVARRLREVVLRDV